jgi:hypothetical protein
LLADLPGGSSFGSTVGGLDPKDRALLMLRFMAGRSGLRSLK